MSNAKFIKNCHRLAGLSLAGCVGLGATGHHKVKHMVGEEEFLSYTTANRYHFLHSLALFTVQFSSIPKITAALFVTGQLLFCVPAYSQGFGVITLEDPKKYAMPFGGTSFMLGWLTHVL